MKLVPFSQAPTRKLVKYERQRCSKMRSKDIHSFHTQAIGLNSKGSQKIKDATPLAKCLSPKQPIAPSACQVAAGLKDPDIAGRSQLTANCSPNDPPTKTQDPPRFPLSSKASLGSWPTSADLVYSSGDHELPEADVLDRRRMPLRPNSTRSWPCCHCGQSKMDIWAHDRPQTCDWSLQQRQRDLEVGVPTPALPQGPSPASLALTRTKGYRGRTPSPGAFGAKTCSLPGQKKIRQGDPVKASGANPGQ